MSLDPRAVEMVQSAHKRQLALRFEVSALTAAVAAGHTTTVGQQAYALSWLAEYAAGRVLELAPDAERVDAHSATWRDGYDTGFAEGASGAFESDGSYKVAAGKGGTPGRAPSAQSPQGAAGTPTTCARCGAPAHSGSCMAAARAEVAP